MRMVGQSIDQFGTIVIALIMEGKAFPSVVYKFGTRTPFFQITAVS